MPRPRDAKASDRLLTAARPTGFEPVTFGFVALRRFPVQSVWVGLFPVLANIGPLPICRLSPVESCGLCCHFVLTPRHAPRIPAREPLRAGRSVLDLLGLAQSIHRFVDGQEDCRFERAKRAAPANRQCDRGHRHVVGGLP